MTDAVQTQMTAAEYFQLPETVLPTELINGELFEMPAPLLSRQDIVLNVGIFFRQIIKVISGKTWVAPIDVHLDDINVLQPDIVWLAANNTQCMIVQGKYLRGAPDLVVEVLSPGTMLLDKRDKFRLYEKYGVREYYWMIHPTETYVEIWQLQEGKFALAGVFGANETFEKSILGQPVPMTTIFGEIPEN